MIGIGIDLRERKQAEQQIRDSEAFAKQILMSSLSGLYIYDLEEGRNVFINPHYTELTGYTVDDVDEMHAAEFETLFHPDDKPAVDRHFDTLALSPDGDVLEIEYRFKRADGRWIWCYSRDSVFRRTDDGRVKQFIGAFLDITEDKQKEEQLRKSRDELERRVQERTAQLRALTAKLTNAEDEERQRLAQLLHDDLQQDLAVTKMRLSLLRQNLRHDEQREAEAADAIQLVDDAIAKTRRLSRELSPVNLRMHGLYRALEALCDDMRTKHGLTVMLDLQPEAEPRSPPVASLIFRCINELLFNVVKHSGENEASVEARQEAGTLQITVRDRGRGFDAEALQAKLAACTAFGLLSIQERFTHMEGSMEVDGRPGEGCCVVLKLPVSAASSPPPDRTPQNQHPASGPERDRHAHAAPIRILLVDDHDVMRESLAAMLDGETDMTVVGQATSGREAIELSAQLNPDVVLMDVSMPEMNGIEATARILRQSPGIRVIGLTMHSDAPTEAQMRGAGAVEFLSKSGSTDGLLSAVRRCVRPQQTGR